MSSETSPLFPVASAPRSVEDRVPWDVVSSRELAELIGVNLQVLANWRSRGKGPAPAPAECFRGKSAYYPVCNVVAWRLDIEPWEVAAQWLRERFIFPKPLETEERTWRIIEQQQGWGIYPLAHYPRRRYRLSVCHANTRDSS